MNKELKAGAALNYVGIAVRMGTSIFMTPFFLAYWGQAEMGLFSICGAIISWIAFMDLGLSAAVVRYIAEAKAKNDEAGMSHLIGNMLALFSVIGTLAFVVGLAVYPFIADIFPKLTPEELEKVKIMYLMSITMMGVGFPMKAFAGITAAYQKFLVPGLVGLCMSWLNIAMTVVLIYYFDCKAVGLTVWSITLGIMGTVWNLYYLFRHLKIRPKWNGIDWALYKKMYTYSIWIFLNQIMDMIYWNSGATILGMTQGPYYIPVFTIAITFCMLLMTCSTSLSGVLFPKVVEKVTLGASNEELTSMMSRVGRLQLIIMIPFLAGFIVFGQAFLKLWVGGKMGDQIYTTWWCAIIMMVPLTVPLAQNLGIQILQAKTRHRVRAIMLIVVSSVSLVIGYFLSIYWGPMGLAAGTALSLIVGQGILVNLYYHYKIKLSMGSFFYQTFFKMIPACGVIAAAGYSLHEYGDFSSWLRLLTGAAIFIFCIALAIRLLYMTKDEVNMLPRFLRFSKS